MIVECLAKKHIYILCLDKDEEISAEAIAKNTATQCLKKTRFANKCCVRLRASICLGNMENTM